MKNALQRDTYASDAAVLEEPGGALSSAKAGDLRQGVISPAQALFFGLTGVGLPVALQGFAGNQAFTSGNFAWLAALIALAIALLLGWIVVRFSSRHLVTGTLMSYVRLEVGPRAGVITGAALFVGYVAALMLSAALATIFVVSLLGSIGVPVSNAFVHTGIGVLLIAVCTALAVRGVTLSVKTGIVLGWIGMPLILVILVGAIVRQGIDFAPQISFENLSFSALIAGAVLAFGQFTSFESFTALAAETASPKRTVPRLVSILLLILGATLLISAVLTAPIMASRSGDLLAGASPLAVLAGAAGMQSLGTVADSIVAIGIIGTTLVYVNGSGRIVGAAAADGILPKSLALVSPRTGTPARATILMGSFGVAGFAGYILLAQQPVFAAFLAFLSFLTYAWLMAYTLLAIAGVVSALRDKDLFFGVASAIAGIATIAITVFSLSQPPADANQAFIPWVAVGLAAVLATGGILRIPRAPVAVGYEDEIG